MDIETRIAQFENMCREDPENDMAWFSLGSAYNQAGRFAEAADAFLKCIEQNEAMSKGYQLAGAALMASGKTDEAADVLTKGYVEATSRGDMMPANAMKDLLVQLGQPIPEVERPQEVEVPEGSFVCARTGRPGTQMEAPPFRGPLGEWIAEHISKETWQDWIGQGTKVINELRLDLSRDEDSEVYDRHMAEFLGIDEQKFAELTGRSG